MGTGVGWDEGPHVTIQEWRRQQVRIFEGRNSDNFTEQTNDGSQGRAGRSFQKFL